MASPIFSMSMGIPVATRNLKRGQTIQREDIIYINGYPGHEFSEPDTNHQLIENKKVYQKAKAKPQNGPTSSDVSSAFVVMFHTRYCRLSQLTKLTTYTESICRYVKIYLRNWEKVLQPNKTEKRLIEDFKAEHFKITLPEWLHLCSIMKKVDLQQDQAFIEFYNLAKASTNANVPQGSFSPIRLNSDTIRSLEEAKKLYLCIYYPNYQELWRSDRFLLNNKLVQLVENFLQQYPLPNVDFINSSFEAE